MRGGDTTGLRAYNERLIVSAIQQDGPMSKAEIARATGLSGQAASVIVNALLVDGLLVKQGKVRGQVGQPFTPIALNPDGAYSLGVKIGRRSLEAILVDFAGEIIGSRSTVYAAPLPDETMALARGYVEELLEATQRRARGRVVGLGVAMPSQLHEWHAELGLAPGALEGWRNRDVAAELEAASDLPVTIYNDATAACAAEMILGEGISRRSALYIYIGTFIGGGVVIDGRLYRGEQLNAGAIGPMPMVERASDQRPLQLIHLASAIQLESALFEAGLKAEEAIDGGGGAAAERVFEAWMARAAPALSRAVVSAISVIDFESVVIDGVLNPAWRRRLAQALSDGLKRHNLAGLALPEIAGGSIGPKARVLGAALLPLNGRFSPDTDLIVNSAAARRSATA